MNQTSELSEREIEILKLVATGLSNKEIAYQLKISPNTVKVHLKNIFSKIGVVSRTEAAMFAVRQGWIESGSQVALEAIEAQESSDLPKAAQLALPPLILGLFGIGLFAAMIILVILLVNLASRGNPQVVEIVVTPTPEPVKWELVTQMPEPKKSMAYAAVDNKIYIIGGETPYGISDRVDIYDTVTGQWSEGARKPTPVSEACGAYLDGKIIVAGGKTGDGKVASIVEAYDVVSNRWDRLAELPNVLAGAGCIVYGGTYYMIGGWDGRNVIRDIWEYRPIDKAWKSVGRLEQPRVYHSIAEVDGKIYIVGGWNGLSGLNSISQISVGNGFSEIVEIYELPEKRYRLASLGVLDKIYVVGGLSDSFVVTSLEINSRDNTQRLIENPNYQEWHSNGTVSIGEYLYSFAGLLGQDISSDFYRLRVLYSVVLPIIRR